MLAGLKQLIGLIASPLMLALLIASVALLLRVLDRRRLSIWLFAFAVILAYSGATAPVANALLMPLESEYPPLNTDIEPPRSIVVLGSHYSPRDGLPVTSTLGSDGLTRIVEGVRLARLFPHAQLIVSGGAAPGYTPSARGYARLALELGIEAERVRIVDTPRDTKQEAAAIRAMLGSSPFVLVTSAAHMPRAMRLMLAAGTRPFPAPTGHRADVSGPWSLRCVLPLASSLRNSEVAMHEYVGLLALSMGLQ